MLAVTPGGNAERMGLRAGDVLVASTAHRSRQWMARRRLRNTVDTLPDGGRLDFNVRRDGRTQSMGGASASMVLPAMHLSIGNGTALASNAGADSASADAARSSPAEGYNGASPVTGGSGCGRISDFDVAPSGQRLHEATIISIDNKAPGPHGSKAYVISAGTHVLKISEHIPSRYFSFNDRQRNAQVGGGYKTLSVDVAPDTTYFVASRLNEEARDNPAHGAYWDPVVWKQVPESCR